MAVGTGRYFSITSRSPVEKWRSAPTVRNPCREEGQCKAGGDNALPSRTWRRRLSHPATYRMIGDHLPGEVHAFRQWDLHPLLCPLCREEGWDEAEPCCAPVYTPSCVRAAMLTVNDGHDGQLQQGFQWGLQ